MENEQFKRKTLIETSYEWEKRRREEFIMTTKQIKREIFLSKCRIFKYKLLGVLYKVLFCILTPFAVMYGTIVTLYGRLNGMSYDEIRERYIYKYRRILSNKKK